MKCQQSRQCQETLRSRAKGGHDQWIWRGGFGKEEWEWQLALYDKQYLSMERKQSDAGSIVTYRSFEVEDFSSSYHHRLRGTCWSSVGQSLIKAQWVRALSVWFTDTSSWYSDARSRWCCGIGGQDDLLWGSVSCCALLIFLNLWLWLKHVLWSYRKIPLPLSPFNPKTAALRWL